jgi:antitoxin (DNA-binding transcriptional repressor) of toxin-antitoxin stability system
MKSVQLSELGPVADEVRNGETIEIRDGEQVVAKVVPLRPPYSAEAYIDELVAQGKATKGTGVLPDWFFTDPLPVSESGSVLEQLLEDRRSRDW